MVYWFGEPIRPQLDSIWLDSRNEWQRRQTGEPVLLSSNPPELLSEQQTPPLLCEVESSAMAVVRPSESGDALAAQGQPEPSLPDEKEEKRNYFLRHWRGELPLPVSYWLNGMLGCLFVGILSGVVSAFDATSGLKVAVAAVIFLYVLSFAVSIWQIVGTWRSASNHTERGGNAVWAGLAKAVLVLGA